MTTFVSNDSLTTRYREGVEFSTHRNDPTVGLSDAWAFAKRRGWLISSVILGCTFLAAAAAFTLPKTYTARSEVVLERKDIRPFATDAALTSIDRDRSAAETELDVLQSRQFAGRIVDRLKLVEDRSFNPYAAGGEKPRRIGEEILRYLEIAVGIRRKSSRINVLPNEKEQRDHAISALLSQLDVSRKGESLAVRITVSSPTPRIAQQIANTIAALYVESSLEFKRYERIADKQRALSTGGAVAFLRQSTPQPLLITLRNEEARLLQTKAELGAKFGKNHPRIIDTNSQIAGVRSMIDDEVQHILSDLEAESLKPSARIISLAERPRFPSFPRPGVMIPAAFAGSIVLALLLALMLETVDKRVRSGQRVSLLLQLPNLGYVPKIPNNPSPETTRSSWSNDTSAEAERSVYMACRYAKTRQAHRFVMITSCHHEVATTSTVWGMATAAAADGRATALVTLDLSRNEVPFLKYMEPSPKPFERYLRSEAMLSEVVQTIPTLPGFGFIDATSATVEPFRALNSRGLGKLILDLKQSGYDFVVLHAPPVLISGDANWLAPFVDGVVLIVSWGKTTEGQLLDTVAQLRLNHAHLIGTVINEVNPKAQIDHG